MKQTINVGAYGWLHPRWVGSFYPEDLPADWRLGYYSNEFNTVLVPSIYWQEQHLVDCEALLDDVHSGFQFFIECDDRIFDTLSLFALTDALKILKPQLSGLVCLGGLYMEKAIDHRFLELADSLEVDMIAGQTAPGADKLWRPDDSSANCQRQARFAIIEDDLRDMRAVRSDIEPFISQLPDQEKADSDAALIVSHPQLQAADLSRFRSVLEIMGH